MPGLANSSHVYSLAVLLLLIWFLVQNEKEVYDLTTPLISIYSIESISYAFFDILPIKLSPYKLCPIVSQENLVFCPLTNYKNEDLL